MKIHLIAAARPNFMKIAPLYHAMKEIESFEIKIVHTGQHYDKNMSADFFNDLKLPSPDFNLGVGGGTQAEQVGNTMIAYEKVCISDKPDLVIVVGDVNATMSCSVTAKKLGIKVAHLEAGIRSFDLTMPEEINRMVTDRICDYFWTPSAEADENLIKEGTPKENITLVGNIMIDSLEMMRSEIMKVNAPQRFKVEKNKYAVVTFHRPSNVDDKKKLEKIIEILDEISEKTPVIFPVHPRTRKNIEQFGLTELFEKSRIIKSEPLNYKTFMSLVFDSKFVVTDSGGIQEETTYLGIPCLTVRDNTERPVTVWEGTNMLVNIDQILENVIRIESGKYKKGKIPLFWDGKTADRVKTIIKSLSL